MKVNAKRLLAALLASVLLITDGTAGFAAETQTDVEQNELEILEGNLESEFPEEAEEEFLQEAAEEEEQPYVLFEMEELREQSVKQYRLSDGTVLAAQYGMDVHYEDEDGEWAEIDNRFLYEAAEGTADFDGYRSAEGAVEFKFAPQVQEGELVKITHEDYEVGFEMLPPVAEEKETAEVWEGSLEEVQASGEVVCEEPVREEPVEDTETLNTTPEIQHTESMENAALEENEETDSEEEQVELAPAQISFLQGEVLNVEEVPAELAAVPAVMSLEEEAEVIWADVSPGTPSEEEAELFEGLKVEDAVTSVGYGNVLPGVSLQYVLSGSSLKEYILVNEKSDSYSYNFAMNLENLEPQMQEDGRILLRDAESKAAVYEIPAGYMTDAAGEVSDAVTMSVTGNAENGWILNVTADAEWINAEERVLPVQIDPTLTNLLKSQNRICGTYVEKKDADGKANTQYGNMMIGYDSAGTLINRAYIQLRNLPALPKESVVCGAVTYFYVMDGFSHVGHSVLDIATYKVKDTTTWQQGFLWNTRPEADTRIMDYRTVSEDHEGTYVGWDITEVVKEHYLEGNAAGSVSAFMMAAYDDESMKSNYCAKAALRLTEANVYPLLQIMYRDTKGVEDYYTYQVHDGRNAGTVYLGDYNGQITLVKPAVSYESTIMSYGLNLVYNSAGTESDFTATDNIHTKDFSSMKLGRGWKLSAQETITEIELTDVQVQNGSPVEVETIWLVYNDGDGTEHYFKKCENSTTKYEDEDGLNLTIEKNGSNYTMTDKNGNSKYFANGYLTKITDADLNEIHIIYNNGSVGNNIPRTDSTNQITAVYSKPYDSNIAATEKIFSLSYSNGYLTKIEETYSKGNDPTPNYIEIGYETRNGKQYLKRIWLYLKGEGKTEIARYGNTGIDNKMSHVLDVETNSGLFYQYAEQMVGCRVNYFRDYAQNGGETYGREVRVTSDDLRKTVYTDSGADRSFDDTDDNIVTTYLFDTFGQTVNAASRDDAGTLLGVSASSYAEKEGTSKTNHRLLKNISTGQTGVSLLTNGSFEEPSESTEKASGWTHQISGEGKIALREDAPHSGYIQYNLYNSSTSEEQKIFQVASLKGGVTYTASAYVNTERAQSFGTDGGAYMMIANTSGTALKEGVKICQKTTEYIAEGWQRISVTYTPASDMNVRVCVVWKNVYGTLRVDDVQLETGNAPSSFNYVNNGSFEQGESGWEIKKLELTKTEKTEEAGSGKPKTIYGTGSFLTKSQPGNYYSAEQSIPMNKSSDTTFLLSGWSRGDSIPDLTKGSLLQTDRLWGVYVKFIYEDGYDEDRHYVQFNEYAEDWQYAALTVVPKHAGHTILEAQVRVYYFNNANWAYFDNISLTEEPAQTYAYDDNGNLVSVEALGNGNEIYEYDTQNLENLEKYTSEGSGIYDYVYSTGKNKHQLVKVTNDNVSLNIGYDNCGEATSTTLTGVGGEVMKSSAAYGNGLLTAQTDNTGATTSYTYTNDRDISAVKNAKNQEIKTQKEKTWGQTTATWQTGLISANFGYLNGQISTLTRGGYLDSEHSDERKYNQIYGFEYDKFGNRTKVTLKGEVINAGTGEVESSSGTSTMAAYEYGSNNGPLTKMTYAPGTSKQVVIDYTYDKLERVNSVKFNDTNTTYGYNYNSEGNLAEITVNGSPAYEYTYDSLGRLIYSAKLQNKRPVLYTSHQYDTSNRLTGQSWQIGNDSFSEGYEYSEEDGTLSKMTVGTQSLNFTYNNLKQLSKRTSPGVDMEYAYRTWKDQNNNTYQTNQVSSIKYLKHGSNNTLLPTLNYSYDVLGNITQIKENSTSAAQYSYDNQNQVTKEILSSQTSEYTYDTYGNIRSKKTTYSDGDYEQYTYIYGNGTSVWKDQLTAVSYRDENGNVHNGTFSYDAVGNPLTYNNGKKSWTFTWQHGRQLATAVSGSTSIANTYDVDGIRESKTVNGVKHNYTTLGGKIVREAYGNITIDYFYDNDGRPFKIVVKNGTSTIATGYYVLNLQGDVIAIVDSTGAVAVKYQYDAWGKEISHITSGSEGGNLYNYNALKYRGYYYDVDLGLYYLNSRYYDAEIGRFIGADVIDILAIEQGDLLQYNLYTYCFNNPVNREDAEGKLSILVCAALGGALAGGLISATSYAVSCSLNGSEMNGREFASAVLFGALTGAAGGAIGTISAPTRLWEFVTKGAYSIVVGYGVGMNTYDGGNMGNAIIAGCAAAVGTFAGSLISTDGADEFGTFFANYAIGLTTGTPAEMLSLTGQQVNSSNNVKAVGNNSTKTQNKTNGACRISSGMTTADYFRQQYNA